MIYELRPIYSHHLPQEKHLTAYEKEGLPTNTATCGRGYHRETCRKKML
jgi:hypothetical protein